MVENDLSPVENTKKKNKTLKNNSNFGIMYSERNCNSDPKLAMNIVKSEIFDGFLNNAQLLNESMCSQESQTKMKKCLEINRSNF